MSCNVDNCNSNAITRGWCKKHYTRWLRYGDPLKSKYTHINARKNFPAEYLAFVHAKSRCRNINNATYKYHGGRGIKFKFSSFEEFFTEVGTRPSSKFSLDRKDNNGHYEKGNIRWATGEEQGNNKRNNILLTYNGITKSISQWSRDLNIRYNIIYRRHKHKWCVDCIFNTSNKFRCTHRRGDKYS